MHRDFAARVLVLTVGALALVAAAACGSGTGTPASTARSSTPVPLASTARSSTPILTATATAPTVTPAPVVTATARAVADPCTTRTSLEESPLTRGVSVALNASTRWQLCIGGAAMGSSEKFLFRTGDGGHTWTLISRTTLGNPPPEAGVGALPNGNGVTQLLFLDADHGWMGLDSPGLNLWRSDDGGVTWTAVPAIPAAVAVQSVAFSSPANGRVVTSTGTWGTSDGGGHWTKGP